jgi:tetratricopeptide (TPR) repeat protein
MKLSYLITFFLFIIITNSFGAGSSGSDTKSSYDKAVKFIEVAKKNEKKEKNEKAIKNYKKALKLLIESNNQKPNNADTLNYLGFTSRKLGDYNAGEKYYLQGLALEPKHNGINEYLGELYVATNRIDLAKERLKVLETCNCEEYAELNDIIMGIKKSKY